MWYSFLFVLLMFHYALNELWGDLGQDIKEEDVMVKWNYFGHRS